VAREAATIVKEGYDTELALPSRDRNAPTYYEPMHMFFTSIREACMRRPRLQQILKTYKISTHGLLQHMHAVDMGLVRRSRHYKLAHSLDELMPVSCSASRT
jgi:hypothetical protein